MDLKTWGSNGWKFLHACTFGYSDEPSTDEKEGCIQFFNNLKYMLPCPKCRHNYEKKLSMTPVENACASREALTKWFVDVHNMVNLSTNKTQMTYDDACSIYRLGPPQSVYDDDCDTPNCAKSYGVQTKMIFNICVISIVICSALLLLGVFLYKKRCS